MRSRAPSVSFNVPQADFELPDVTESRRQLIDGVKAIAAYHDKKHPLYAQLHAIVHIAENRGALYADSAEATSERFIQHMNLLTQIGEALNPKSGYFTGRPGMNASLAVTANSNVESAAFSDEDSMRLIKFLVSEAKLCKMEIEQVTLALEAYEKRYGNHVLYTAGMTAIEHDHKGSGRGQINNTLKLQYHRVQDENYRGAETNLIMAAKCFSEAQIFDAAVKKPQGAENTKRALTEEAEQRTAQVNQDQRQTQIESIIDGQNQKIRETVNLELSTLEQILDSADQRDTVAHPEGVPKQLLKDAKEEVKKADKAISSLNKEKADNNKSMTVQSKKIHELEDAILKDGTKHGAKRDESEKQYVTLLTKSSFYRERADKMNLRADNEINLYRTANFSLSEEKEHLANQDVAIRIRVAKFRALDVTVNEFTDNLKAFAQSAAPMAVTRDRSNSTSISKKTSTETLPPSVRALQKLREQKDADAKRDEQAEAQSQAQTKQGIKIRF